MFEDNPYGSPQSAAARPPGGDQKSIRVQIALRVQKMLSSLAKATSGFSKALPGLSGEKGKTMRAIISSLRGFGSVADAIAGGDLRGVASACKGFGDGLKRVAEVSRKKGLGFLLRRGGAFIPALGTGLEAHAAYKAIQKGEAAAKRGNQTAAAIWGGAAAVHTLAATLSGCVDLLLALSLGSAGPAYAAVNGVVSGLGALADIAGSLAE